MTSQRHFFLLLQSLLCRIRRLIRRDALNRASVFLWGLLRRFLLPRKSNSSTANPTSHSHDYDPSVPRPPLIVPLNSQESISEPCPIFASRVPRSLSRTSRDMPPLSSTQIHASQSSQSVNLRPSLGDENPHWRRLSSPGALSELWSPSAPNAPDVASTSRAPREHSPRPSVRSRFSWASLGPAESRSSSRSRTHRDRREPRRSPDPYRPVGLPTVGLSPAPNIDRPTTPQKIPRRMDTVASSAYELAVFPASPRSSHSSHLPTRSNTPTSIGDTYRLRDVNKMFCPISPEILTRYERRETVPATSKTVVINPITMEFDNRVLPPGWLRFVSPEGSNCFYHPAKRIWTDANIYSSTYFELLQNFIVQYEEFLRSAGVEFHLDSEIVMDLSFFSRTGEWLCLYYCVNHQRRTVFWLDDFDIAEESIMWGEVRGVTEDSHLGVCIEKFYWEHATMFPMSRDKYALEDLRTCRGLLLQAWSDTMTSLTSTFPFNATECQTYLQMMDHVEKEIASNPNVTCENISFPISRLMNDFTKSRFMNFYGEPSVRLNRDDSVHSAGPRTHTWLITMMRPILFRAPDAYLTMLEQVYVDGMTHSQSWKVVISKMSTEWQEITLFATVLLNANVGFLDIEDVASGTRDRTPAQVASYLSTITSIGSIIIGLLLIRMNRDHAGNDSAQALEFLTPRESNIMGLEILAMLYSMPFSLLMWSMVLFLVAFTLMCMVDAPNYVRISVSSIWWVVLLLVLWALYVTWDRNHGDRLSPIMVFLRRLKADNTKDTEHGEKDKAPDPQDQDQGGSQDSANRAVVDPDGNVLGGGDHAESTYAPTVRATINCGRSSWSARVATKAWKTVNGWIWGKNELQPSVAAPEPLSSSGVV